MHKHGVTLSLTQPPGILVLFLLLFPLLSRIEHGLSTEKCTGQVTLNMLQQRMGLLRKGEDDLLVDYSNTTLNVLVMCHWS